MTTTMLLTRHGTRPTELPLGAIITAAETDIRRRHAPPKYKNGLKTGYAFAPKHIKLARTAAELLLVAAQDDGGVAETTAAPNRALLYSNPERLVEAAERALGAAPAMAAE